MNRFRRIVAAPILAAGLLFVNGCDEEVVVRVSTRVEVQGGVSRRAEIAGTQSDGSKPEEADWLLSKARVDLARRDAWARVEESPGRIVASGFFPRAQDLPPTVAHRTDRGAVADRCEASLAVDDFVVLERRVWRESVGDPFGAPEVAAALDAILGTLGDALRGELRSSYGESVDLTRTDAFVERKVRAFATDLLPAIRAWKTLDEHRPTSGPGAWSEVFRKHGIRVADPAEGLLAGENLTAVSDWMRAGVAAAVSTSGRPVAPADLTFWPEGDDAEEQIEAIADSTFGDDPGPRNRLEAAFHALGGLYGDAGGPRFRFESKLLLPGRLLRTNGTPDRDGIVWFHRDRDLGAGERVLEAESVELDDDVLRTLGARREYDTAQLLHLADLLAARDPDGALRRVLRDAVGVGRLSLLRDETRVPESLRALARELADVLDPAVEAGMFP